MKYQRSNLQGIITYLTAHTGVSCIPDPTDLTSHPLRDVWVQNKGKWTRIEEAVAWEGLHNMSYTVQCDVLLCVYRRSAMDYRRFAEAEAEMLDYVYWPKTF